MKIGFIGVGKLGQSCAEVLAEKYDVIGYDVQPRSPANFPMVSSLDDACVGRDLIFVAVPTPHDPMYDGNAPTSHLPPKDFDYSAVKSVLQRVDSVVAPGTPAAGAEVRRKCAKRRAAGENRLFSEIQGRETTATGISCMICVQPRQRARRAPRCAR